MGNTYNPRAWNGTSGVASNDGVDAGIGTLSDSMNTITIDNVLRGLMASIKNESDDLGGAGTVSGTDTLTLTTKRAISEAHLVNGYRITARAAGTNTVAGVTLSVDSIPAKTLKDARGAALAVGAIAAGDFLDMAYDAANDVYNVLTINSANASLSAANTFTAAQTISLAATGTALAVESTDSGAGIGPLMDLKRSSGSPTMGDILAALRWVGKDDGGNDQVYAQIRVYTSDVGDGSEEAVMDIMAATGGTVSAALSLGSSGGAWTTGATGGAKGANTFNAGTLYESGTALSSKYFLASSAGSLATADTINNSDWSGTDLAVENGGTGASTPAGARSALELGSLATASTVNNGNWSGTDLAVANGGTGASSLSGLLRGNGTSAITGSATINNGDWSGTDLSVANGGTGASTLSGLLRGNGTSAITGSSTINNDDWSGADLAVANGGTGASTAQDAANNTVGQVATQASAAGSALGIDGSGNVKKYSVANVLAAMGTTKGNILWYDGSAWTVLAPPGSGGNYALTINGSTNVISWAVFS